MGVLFHVAFPMKNVEETKRFYVDGLGCALGRESKVALTLNLGGHQIVAQMTTETVEKPRSIYPAILGWCLPQRKNGKPWRLGQRTRGYLFSKNPVSGLQDHLWNTTPFFS